MGTKQDHSGNEDQEPSSGSSSMAGEAPVSFTGLSGREWAFGIEDRGFRVRGSYQDELSGNIEITRGGKPFKTFTYPGYRIWNIAAHFHDYVSEWLAEQDAAWREADVLAEMQRTDTSVSDGTTVPDSV